MSETGIVIITYNSGAVIGACLDAAIGSGAEIVVIDNQSRDTTVAEVRKRGVRLIANPTNRGFAAAANQGFAVLQTTYVLLLNPDAEIISDLEPLREACDLPESGAAGGRLLGSNGAPQIGFMVRKFPSALSLALEALLLNRVWPNNPANRRYRGLGLDYQIRQEVEQPAGAFLMVRRAAWQELGGFDEGFQPLWFEDVDFCRRLVNEGYRLYYEPRAVAKHTGGHSIPELTVEMRQFYWYRSLLRYSAKHFRPMALRAVCLAVVTGSILRIFGELVLHRSLQPIAAYGKVVRLACRYFLYGWGDGSTASAPRG
jgi:N-acetylglucosaminyl-diphospho-decaprenol L-rhamnosyltransferase